MLEIHDLTVRRRSAVVIDGLSTQLRVGKVTAIIGPNGAGKSTLLKAILGILPIEKGTIRWAGQSLLSLSTQERARLIAYVPQRSQLIAGLTIMQVVAMGRFSYARHLKGLSAKDQHIITSALQQVDAQHLIERRFDELSCGEGNRILLARALATEAPVILLDEPTTALDIGHTLVALKLLRRLADSGRTVVTVLHPLHEVRQVADEVIMLHHGRLVRQGTVDAVLTDELLAQVFGVTSIPGGACSFRPVGMI